MADSIREQIIQGFKDQAEKITLANGYNTDVGAVVERGIADVRIEKTPAFSFVLPGTESSTREFGVYILTMPVEINAIHTLFYTDTDGVLQKYNSSVLAERILGDLIKGILGNRSNISLMDDINYTGGGIEDYPTPEDQLIWVRASFDIVYPTTIGDPYSQP